MIERIWNRFIAPMDKWLLFFVFFLFVIGLISLSSAAKDNPGKITTQLFYGMAAFSLMWVIAQIPLQHLVRAALPIYLISLALLVGVFLFGQSSKGAQRWLNFLGAVRFQPSELMKIAVPLALAWYFHKHEESLKIRHYIVATILVLIPALLVKIQPDLGTAILIFASGFFVIFLAGLSWKLIVGFFITAAATIPFVIWPILHEYQKKRIKMLLDPSQDPLGAGYHIIQSIIAVGSGGMTGKGWGNGTQTHLEFIPERSTDFVFAVYSEEFGLVGCIVLVLLYLGLISRGLVIAANAPTLFARLVAGAITLTLFTSIFVNMGMVVGILPIVGIPLPLMSYGGTALITLFISFGVLMSIQKNPKLVQT